MYFTNTPTLNSIEVIMKKMSYGTQNRRRSVLQLVQIYQERLRFQT